MKKFILFSFVLLLVNFTEATALSSKDNQKMSILFSKRSIGNIWFNYDKVADSFKQTTEYRSMIPMGTSGAERQFRARDTNQLDKDWNWKNSTLVWYLIPQAPTNVTVDGKQVKVKGNLNGSESFQAYDYSGMVMPRRTFYSYLRTVTPPEPLTPKEVYLFNEISLQLKKAQWTYLGDEKVGKEDCHKYEISGEVKSLVFISKKTKLFVLIKEPDLGLEYRAN